jgi:hypothetical protein
MKERSGTENEFDVITNWCLLNLRTHIFLVLPKKDKPDLGSKYTKTYLRIHKNVYLIRKKCVFVVLGLLK